MRSYTYTPLPTPTSIRVLRFPKCDETTGKISTSFRVIDLADCHGIRRPLYHTLSYTWGNPHADGRFFSDYYTTQAARYATQDEILVDNCALPVNRNLHDALLSMKSDSWRRFCNSRTKLMRSQLHFAVLQHNLSNVQALVKSGVDLDLIDDTAGWTPLMYAAALGEEEIVKVLLTAGADARFIDANGETPAAAAKRNGWEKIADLVASAVDMESKENKNKTKFGDNDDSEYDQDGPEQWIWIDQLCINQTDLKERGHQVSMMGEIYSNAFWTLVWLGAEDDYTSTALQVIHKLADKEKDMFASKIFPYIEQPEEVYVAAKIPYISSAEWTALASIFQRQYFRRMWVIQENLLSRTAIGLCGNVELPWRQLFNVAEQLYIKQVLNSNATSAKYIDNTEAALQIEYRANQLVQWIDRWLNGERANNPKPCTLGTLVADCWTFHATDARDKIFGFYGLLNLLNQKTGEQLGKEVDTSNSSGKDVTKHKTVWVADYSKPTAQVFAEATKAIIRESGNLAMLGNVLDISLKRTEELPSWCPDFSVHFTNALPTQKHDTHRKAVSKSLPFNNDDLSWKILPVLLQPLDTILEQGTTTSGPGDTSIYFSRAWVTLALLLPTPYHDTGVSRTEVLWRTLTADTALSGAQPAPAVYGSAFRELVSTMICLAAREEAERFAGFEREEGKVLRLPECPAPSLEIAVEHVRSTWQNPVLKNMTKEALKKQFGDIGQDLNGQKWEAFVYVLMGLHVLAMTEIEEKLTDDESKPETQDEGNPIQVERNMNSMLFTPTLDQLLEFETRLNQGLQNEPGGAGVRLLPDNPDLLHVFKQTLGRRRLFVTQNRYLGIGPAGMMEGDHVVLIKGFGLAIVRPMNTVKGLVREPEGSSQVGEVGPESDNMNKPDGRGSPEVLEHLKDWNFIGESFVFGIQDREDVLEETVWKEVNLI